MNAGRTAATLESGRGRCANGDGRSSLTRALARPHEAEVEPIHKIVVPPQHGGQTRQLPALEVVLVVLGAESDLVALSPTIGRDADPREELAVEREPSVAVSSRSRARLDRRSDSEIEGRNCALVALGGEPEPPTEMLTEPRDELEADARCAAGLT